MLRAKGKFIYNPGQNILKLFNVLVQVGFATSERKLNIYNHFYNILILFSPQVKPSKIVSNKHRIYALPYKLPKNLRIY